MIIIEQVIDCLLTMNINIKREALSFLLGNFSQLSLTQKERLVAFCSKYEASVQNAQWLSPQIPRILRFLFEDNSLGHLSRVGFISHMKKLHQSKNHTLKVTFIDCLKVYADSGCSVEFGELFHHELGSYFCFSELFTHDFNADDSFYSTHQSSEMSIRFSSIQEGADQQKLSKQLKSLDVEDFDVYCHLITNLPTVSILGIF